MKKFIKPFLLPIAHIFFIVLTMFAIMLYLFVTKYDSFVFKSNDADDWGENCVELIKSCAWAFPVVSGFFLLLFAFFLKMTNFKHTFDCRNMDWKTIWMPIIGTTLSVLSIGHLYSIMYSFGLTEEPNKVFENDVLTAFLTFCFGSVFFGMVYREAIIRYLLLKGASVFQAFLCSVLCYSSVLVLNYKELPYIILQGTVFVLLYVKTGSMILEIVFLFLLFFFRYFISPYVSIDYSIPLYCNVAFFVILTPPAIFLLWKFWKTHLPDGRHLPFDDAKIEVVE